MCRLGDRPHAPDLGTTCYTMQLPLYTDTRLASIFQPLRLLATPTPAPSLGRLSKYCLTHPSSSNPLLASHFSPAHQPSDAIS
ncbi:hypothetical protein IAQ61_004043 [Plenodomus lingam]|uniref:uncharacterized protein n=1 Tax=Leptosphaeria maculans TaxID=5022 RepID=UPI00332B1F94|nr:hypothetical protein IAQ61_004043 [Plenodomus lingam]